ncbi:sugar phosphate isomerase/epimerase and 4-hydroxyphenylpyruvate domain-containing protein [Aureimonas altamirensis]|uniref:bifunctional sugar phosphate isomerase/epimerase/4-hydroxyphenylpyruvate dioxygenase family protein n=1 Tax=Aureimonas altamirensis TaxID=370622 RepID=UPI0020373E67|nr:sugar phosphate isomerase/epimerase and 4-hydroxyphenylpyruvate domain-containing protein [Aureimonas altamirensis]MCM2505472.1 sugar phosphate isomerase/epimerase and 4-hydroxyphenylpyruvate domain-containing protein [Aureimonas altamirensis]
MKTSIATVSISGSLPEKLEAIAAAGFDGIEIFEQDFIANDAAPRDVGRAIRDMGLEITLFQPFRDFEGLPEPLRRKAFERAERKFDLMGELGTDLMLVCSSVHPDALGGIDRMAADFAELGERAARRGLRVGYEALAWGRHVNDHRDAWEVVRRADHPSIGLIVDSFHTLARKIDPDTIRRIPGDRIFFVQLADAPQIDMDLLYWSRHFRNMPGEGDLDVTRFMAAVAATGYGGPVSLEIFNDQFRSASPRTIAADGYRSLVALVDDVRRLEDATALEPAAMPPRSIVSGVSFVEFASAGGEAHALGRTLGTLGFSAVARHIGKKLTLFQQGDIRIVLNEEGEGHAHSAWLVHGTSVCDVGLSVADAAATLERAGHLGETPFSQPLSPGELDIPAIRGLGGSVLHFLDDGSGLARVWDVEFEPLAPDLPRRDCGLTRVDHLAQTMSYDEMLSWSLFYTTLFDMGKSAMVDVVDPDGLVRSQALATADGSFRMTLNGAETHRTMAGHFLRDNLGAAIQHIAFACDDIFATAAAFAANGFRPLPIPSNYYDDLAARLDVEPALLARMKAAQIFYDRDGEAEFFQMYSRLESSGFFFEIVERRGGYSGYGAPNAPFRIAAQKRLMPPKGIPKL